MRAVTWFWLCFSAWAQTPPSLPPDQPAAVPADQKADGPSPQSPVASSEHWISGSIDLGYRWQTGPGGNKNVYRSIVDLGSGPKLLDADFSIVDPKHRWFDRIDTRAANWGDDPYTTLSVAVYKKRTYDFSSSYKNIAYFNDVPTFANPLLDRGVLTSERTFDVRNRMSSFDLTIRPGTAIVPYFSYDRASAYGDGVTTFVSDQNEYPVPFHSNFSQNNIRAGLRIESNRYHVTIEQGGTTFHDDQALYQSAGPNPGNRGTPYLGSTLYLNGLSQTSAVSDTKVLQRPWLQLNQLLGCPLMGNTSILGLRVTPVTCKPTLVTSRCSHRRCCSLHNSTLYPPRQRFRIRPARRVARSGYTAPANHQQLAHGQNPDFWT